MKKQLIKKALSGLFISTIILSNTSLIYAQTLISNVGISNFTSGDSMINYNQENFSNINGDFHYSNESYYTTKKDDGKHTLVFTVDSNVVMIDGTETTTETAPFIKNGTTMLPLRAVTDTIRTFQNNISVNWNSYDKSIKIDYMNDIIVFKADEKDYTINGTKYTMSGSTPEIRDNRVYIPLRTLSEAINLNIQWDNANKRIIIYK